MTDDIIKPVRIKLLDEDERHDVKHDNARNELEEIQQQITQLWESVIEIRKDVEKLMAIWSFGQRMSDASGLRIIDKSED